MAGRGATTFQKRQKEQNRKEKREEKLARRAQRKAQGGLQEDDMGVPFDPLNPDADLTVNPGSSKPDSSSDRF